MSAPWYAPAAFKERFEAAQALEAAIAQTRKQIDEVKTANAPARWKLDTLRRAVEAKLATHVKANLPK